MPLFSIFFFLFILNNMSVPLSSNFIGELLVFLSLYENLKIYLVFSSLVIIFGAVYSLWLYNRVCFGKLTKYLSLFSDLNKLEFNILLIFFFFNCVLGVFPKCLIKPLEYIFI
jgi:NADH:ubiquinone oxidoreductase subunit 4 (subunit M)